MSQHHDELQAVAEMIDCIAEAAEDVIAHCAQSLARFKCPTAVEFVAELPHSAIGKVRKTLLRSEGAP